MTTVAGVEGLLARARRFQGRIEEWRGSGETWDYTFPDGITEHYTIVGMRPTEQLADDVASLFVWEWSTKDHLKGLARAKGKNPQRIEDLVNRTPALCLVGDVANRLKHGGRARDPRTPYDPRLGTPIYTIQAVKQIVFSAEGISVTPETLEVSYPVLDSGGSILGDAVVILTAGIGYWETELAAL